MHDDAPGMLRGPLSRQRLVLGAVMAVLLPLALTLLLAPLQGQLNLAGDALTFVLVTVVVALVGGLLPALAAAVWGALLLNFAFTPPLRTLAVEDPNNLLALLVFVAVAMLVSWVVDLAARRGRLAARAESLAEVDRTRTALLAAVGHDLRTPLAAAKAAVSALRTPGLPLTEDDRLELSETADESLDKLSALIANLLDLSRLQAGAMAVDLRPVALDEVLARVLDDVGEEAAVVRLDVPPGLPEAYADAGLLERVLVNLVRNALRFSPTDNPPRLEAALVGRHVEVRVVDRGPGIAAEHRERVFTPFQRLGDTDNTTGVGLGLALARGLTEAMQGTLEPEDTPGGGLTMVVRLRAGDEVADARPGRRERQQEVG